LRDVVAAVLGSLLVLIVWDQHHQPGAPLALKPEAVPRRALVRPSGVRTRGRDDGAK